jgi:hypothetical protein
MSTLANDATAGLGLFVLGAGLCYYIKSTFKSPSMQDFKEGYISPPLPPDVVRLLQASRLCHFATQGDFGEPHLSLMNFTYHRPEEVIIMGTSRDTAKYKHLQDISQTVAILIHDFPHLVMEGKGDALCGKSFSITLKGRAEICDEGSTAEANYREIHLKANPEYAQFSKSGAIVIVRVEKARLCDINDKVTTWIAPSASS